MKPGGTDFLLKKLISSGQVWSAQQNRTASGPVQNDNPSPLSFLQNGNIHEWTYAAQELTGQNISCPPLYILTHFLLQLLAYSENANLSDSLLFFIGRKTWPTPYVINEACSIFTPTNKRWNWEQNCIFLDLNSPQERLTAAISTLHNHSVFAAIIDGTDLSFKESRKLQLAARQGDSRGCLIKTPQQLNRPSMSQTKWLIKPQLSTELHFSWELILNKAPGLVTPLTWQISVDYYEENSFHISPFVIGRHKQESAEQKEQTFA